MKPGVSSLNPYAASYVPLAKRAAETKDSKSGNESAWFEPYGHITQNQYHRDTSLNSNAHATEKLPVPEAFSLKSHPAHVSYGSSSQNLNEMTDKQMLDEEFDMDLEYLQMTFPGISSQSLADVYMANRGDLEAAVDMLNQLEFYTVETSENLPDTLDIGDVSESGTSAECVPMKPKKVDEASSSSSGPSDSAVVT